MSNLRLVEGPEGREFIVDRATGEVLAENGPDGRMVFIMKTEKRNDDFVTMNQKFLKELATAKKGRSEPPYYAAYFAQLTAQDFRLFFYCLSICKFENWIDCSNKQIAAAMGLPESRISESFARLKAASLIDVVTDDVNWNRKRVNVLAAWRGNAKALRVQVKEQFNQLMLDFNPEKMV